MALVKKLHSFFTSIQEVIKQMKKKKERENPFLLRNGSILLEELIATCNGVYNPIRSFSVEQLKTATNNFQSSHNPDQWFMWYKGTLDGRPILVRNYYSTGDKDFANKETYRDIAISIKMSDHSNVLKLIGCCLELQNPILVYEDAEFGSLDRWLEIHSNGSYSFPWKKRLKVATDIAHVLTFLHTAFARPIVHRDINSHNILLDKDYNAKLTGFSLSMSIPEGETIVKADTILARMGYVDPEYVITGYVSEKSDVYSFGIFMIELLTGKSLPTLVLIIGEEDGDYLSNNCRGIETRIRSFFNYKPLDKVVDSKILEGEGGIGQDQQYLQFEAYLKLALRCIELKSGDRPLMIDVAKELKHIERGQPR